MVGMLIEVPVMALVAGVVSPAQRWYDARSG